MYHKGPATNTFLASNELYIKVNYTLHTVVYNNVHVQLVSYASKSDDTISLGPDPLPNYWRSEFILKARWFLRLIILNYVTSNCDLHKYSYNETAFKNLQHVSSFKKYVFTITVVHITDT